MNNFFGDDFVVPTFSDAEPGDGQRWSTWPAITPSERGPQPWPAWVVTSAAAIDTELGVLKTGKEADVFLVERAVPDDPAESVLLAAKRYRSPEHRDFHRSGVYREGRIERRSRDQRAVERGTAYGRSVAAVAWANAEFGALVRAYELGLPVPYPVQVDGTELLLEFIGEGGAGAPRLAQTAATGDELAELYDQVERILLGFARAGWAHGDLSAYNLLVHRGRVVVIDLPQLVDVIANPNGMSLLERDCRNVCAWFARRGLDQDPDELFGRTVAELF
ncbi:serine protein kinase RIO [Protaetiibacter mangrovi]|uniref:non-specific serine/threonine protein kinase n=1 Tax=Protaetiibacter mangrovi TaxID=2970926 RepID=A0ABT1ZIC9_9MICO|nr:RIO1 family regulatory kinase/ATPase [Protaetiibacter mangrovi]MCS0500473.1 serine/threonine protein kinase [Protaetiibacter mangrovi]